MEAAKPWIVVPNWGHRDGVNDAFAYGKRAYMWNFMDRFDLLRRFWFRHVNTTEGVLCELMRRKRLRVGVTPLCVVRTRATGQGVNRFVQEHLNGTSAGPIGLPAQCDGVPTVQTGDDTLMPCPPLVRVFPTQCLRRAEEHGEVRMRWAAQCQADKRCPASGCFSA